jgi:hypothetical protein
MHVSLRGAAGAAAGPVLTGLGLWCALGELAVATADSASQRVAVPAPWWVLPMAVAAAAAVPVWRRRPPLALPALFTILPWLPVPLPAVALLWTGPLAWAPLGGVVLATWGGRLAGAAGRATAGWPPRRAAAAAGLVTIAGGALTAWSIDPQVPRGDEPQYLIITQSLLSDGDLRIENNHDRRDYAAYFDGEIDPDYRRRGVNGEIYSIHAPGVSVVILPAFWALGHRGAQLTLLILAGLAAAFVWRTALLVTGQTGAAWFAWAAIAGSATFLLQSATVFPDGPGAFVTAAACWLLVRLHTTPAVVGPCALVLVSLALAVLPWLHTRFAVIAAGFGVAIVWGLVRDRSRAPGGRVRRVAAFVAIPAAGAAAWFGFFAAVYGTLDPRAPYGDTTGSVSWTFVPGGVAGLLFDQQFGLLAYAPVLAAAAAGAWLARRATARTTVLTSLAISLVYVMAVATYWMWWAGVPATPARFANAMLPALGPALALGWAGGSAMARALWSALLAVSLAISVIVLSVFRADLAWNVRTEETKFLEWLAPVVNLPRGWPGFFWRLDPAQLRSELPFFAHVAAAAAAGAVGLAALVALGRRGPADRRRLVLALGLPLIAMATVQLGWMLTGARGLDPARAQIAVLGATAAGARAIDIAPLSAAPVRTAVPSLVIGAEEAPVHDGDSAPYFANLPSGRYEVWLDGSAPLDGALAVRIGRSPSPLRVARAGPGRRHVFSLALPAGAAGLSLDPDKDLRRAHPRMAMVPVSTSAPDGPVARLGLRYGDVDAFFLGRSVYAENEGFWVEGGGQTEMLFVGDAGRRAIELDLQNGPVPNAIWIQGGVGEFGFTLAPDERRSVTLPADAAGAARARISSSAGFRPADRSDATDTRYLGVWGRPR